MLEVMTPEMTERYVEITDPEFMKAAFAETLAQTYAQTNYTIPNEAALIG
jgi:hypothetical protein